MGSYGSSAWFFLSPSRSLSAAQQLQHPLIRLSFVPHPLLRDRFLSGRDPTSLKFWSQLCCFLVDRSIGLAGLRFYERAKLIIRFDQRFTFRFDSSSSGPALNHFFDSAMLFQQRIPASGKVMRRFIFKFYFLREGEGGSLALLALWGFFWVRDGIWICGHDDRLGLIGYFFSLSLF